MPGLCVQNIHKSFPDPSGSKKVLNGVTFTVQPGQVSALLGPSGCGKSTLLSLIGGLELPDQGQISWDETDLANVPAHRRGFGLMFQEYALFPHLNVFENIAFGLRMAKTWSESAIRTRVAETLALVGLDGFSRRDVLSLSGGEQQRIALARSLAPQPCFLMLDEPLGALDHTLRERLIIELGAILRSLRQTALYVTHDHSEAFALADEVILLNEGRVEQSGSPASLYQSPNNPFVARFLGLTNLIPATASGETAECSLGILPLPAAAQGPVTLLLRPDAFSPAVQGSPTDRSKSATPDSPLITGTVMERVFRGSVLRTNVLCQGQNLSFDLPSSTAVPQVGDVIQLSPTSENAVQVLGSVQSAK